MIVILIYIIKTGEHDIKVQNSTHYFTCCTGNRCVFKSFLKHCTFGASRIVLGKLFHNVGPKTENDESPKDFLVEGIARQVQS